MQATPFDVRRQVMAIGLAVALTASTSVPLLGGQAATRPVSDRGMPGTAASSLGATTRQRFENTEVRLGLVDGVGTVASSSAIAVSGLPGSVIDVDVNLIDINHGPASTQDIDVLLIGPDGKSALILSDVGGDTATQNVTLVLDDQQADQLPSAAALTNGFFQPTNFGSPDTMNLGNGPVTPPSGASLSVFNGIDPNGTWRLWAYDDTPNGSSPAGGGINGGWAVTITTAADDELVARPDRFRVSAGKTLRVKAPGVLKNDRAPENQSLTAVLASKPKQGQVELKPNGSFTYVADRNAKGSDRFTYRAKASDGTKAKASVRIKIRPRKDS